MQGFWSRFGDRYLGAIMRGTLEVAYPSGERKTYGNGEAPHATLVLHKSRFFMRVALYGDIGFAESYMDEEFDTPNLAALIELALLNAQALGATSNHEKKNRWVNLIPHLNRVKHMLRKNSKTRARKNISQHYDLSNDFFSLMLDPTMMYSSAVFGSKEETLFDAQMRKLEMLAQKLHLKKGDHVLEIGSGWGAMALHLAQHYGCHVTTVTLSKEQKTFCEARFEKAGVAHLVTVLLIDYRDIKGQFDAIISIEMFEAVGKHYFKSFFKQCAHVLKPHGLLVMQVITIPDSRYEAYAKGSDFIQKYIFPGGHLPSVERIVHTTAKHTRLQLLEMQTYSEHYAKTLQVWYEAFQTHMSEVKALGFDDYFIRMWQMYLCYCEAAFITRNIDLVQLVFTQDQNISLNQGLLS